MDYRELKDELRENMADTSFLISRINLLCIKNSRTKLEQEELYALKNVVQIKISQQLDIQMDIQEYVSKLGDIENDA